jgi:aminocarboxymuconate-semialdehyde decarboxylase
MLSAPRPEGERGIRMPEQWNKYAPTAARRHGRAGRELRPTSVTIDIHSHVAVPAAAKFVEPYLDWASIPLAHFANAETRALSQKQESDIRAVLAKSGRARSLGDDPSQWLHRCFPADTVLFQ